MNLQTESTMAGIPPKASQSMPSEHAASSTTARHDPPAVSLDERGMIKDCNKSFEKRVGFRRSELVWHHVSMVFPELQEVELFQNGQINPMLNYQSRCGRQYQMLPCLGETTSERLNFVSIENRGKRTLRLIVLS